MVALNNPLFPRLRSGHRLFQRPSPKKQFPSILAGLAGKPVRFRFHLEDGSLYSFWVSKDPDGASGGYLGAGGPRYAGLKDAVKKP